jgi:adenine-specific DNA-methyltransferase
MENIQKFQDLLKKLFQFESSDLDFGIYRILNYERDAIEKFIQEDLVNKIENAFAKHKDKRTTNIHERFESAKGKIFENFGDEAFTPTGELKEEFKNTPLGKDFLTIKAQKEEIEHIDEIKLQVFNDLYNFFSRYYEDGDFVPQYRYSIKSHKYTIPYNGEEVKLYWSNSDQYYTKTGSLFRDYTFKTFKDDYKVIFRIVLAKEELGSNKAKKDRFFVLDDETPVELRDKTAIIYFQYRELTDKEKKFYDAEGKGRSNTKNQEKINQKSYEEILTKIDDTKLKDKLKEYKNGKPFLLYHISRFTSENTNDYFIHKNLKKFLTEQLDYFVKAEVLDINTLVKERFLDKHITRAKLVQEIGEDIIDFLSQIEDFQKKLWEKKKFVLKTEYVITTDRVPEDFYDEIWKNKEQKKEWNELGFEIPKVKKGLKDKKLPIDTKHFSIEFKEKLLEKLTEKADLDDLLDGLLIKSENWQALNTILNKYREKIKTIYIDPPYNTGSDGFLYRDSYQHSSWLTMMENRLSLAKELMRDDGVIFVSIDDNEVNELNILLKTIPLIKVSTIKIFSNPRGRQSSLNIAESSEYLLVYSKKNQKVIRGENISEEKRKEYKYKDNIGFYRLLELRHRGSGSDYYYVESLDYPIFYNPQTGDIKLEYDLNYIEIRPVGKTGKGRWTWSKEKLKEDKHLLVVKQTKNGKWRVFRKDYLNESELSKPLDMWIEKEINYDRSSEEIRNLFKDKIFTFAKPIYLIYKILNISTNKDSFILDFFAGSGTTAHAVMKLNKEDGGKRKFILVEMGDHFNTVIVPRIKKVAYSFNWKDGKPQDSDGIGGFFKYQILEQYEDALGNIELQEKQSAQKLFKNDYLIKYFLDYETRESPYLLNIDYLKNPFDYKLKVNLEEVGASQEMVVDIPETFNYLLGLKIKKIKTRKNGRKYLFILGEKEEKDYAIVWREYNDEWSDENFKKDKEFIIQELKDWTPHVVYINGQSTLTPKNFEIRLIEPELTKLMRGFEW